MLFVFVVIWLSTFGIAPNDKILPVGIVKLLFIFVVPDVPLYDKLVVLVFNKSIEFSTFAIEPKDKILPVGIVKLLFIFVVFVVELYDKLVVLVI